MCVYRPLISPRSSPLDACAQECTASTAAAHGETQGALNANVAAGDGMPPPREMFFHAKLYETSWFTNSYEAAAKCPR